MRRLFDLIVRNWPLKLAALGLAVVLYAGVVLSGNAREWPGDVAIAIVDPPVGGVLLTPPGSVTDIQYRAPLDLAGQLTSRSFRATIDLSGITPEPGGPVIEVPVQLVALDPRVTVVSYEPRSVDVRLDSVQSRTVPVSVARGVAPEGLVLGPPQVDPSSVLLRGASSRLAQVHSVVARVVLDASGLNVDQEVALEAVDEADGLVPGIEVVPRVARVRIDVARELAYAVLPVVVRLAGVPAAGHRVDRVRVDPVTVTVSGEAPSVDRLSAVTTGPVPVDGLTSDTTRTVGLELPPDISLIGAPDVTVTVGIVPSRGSRALEAGLVVDGARRDRQTTLSTGSVLVTLAGGVAALDALEDGDLGGLVATVDVSGLGVGRHEAQVRVDAPDGLEVLSVAPGSVLVTIGPAQPPPTASSGGSAPPTSGAPFPSGSSTDAIDDRVTPSPSSEPPGGS